LGKNQKVDFGRKPIRPSACHRWIHNSSCRCLRSIYSAVAAAAAIANLQGKNWGELAW